MPSQVQPVSVVLAVPGALVVVNPYILVYRANIIVDEIEEEYSLRQIFYCSGLQIETQLYLLVEHGLASFLDLIMLTKKDVSTMDSGFLAGTQGNIKLLFGTRRTNSLKSLVQQIQDFYTESEDPDITGLNKIVLCNSWKEPSP